MMATTPWFETPIQSEKTEARPTETNHYRNWQNHKFDIKILKSDVNSEMPLFLEHPVREP